MSSSLILLKPRSCQAHILLRSAQLADPHALRDQNGVDRPHPCEVSVEEERTVHDPHHLHHRPADPLDLLQGVGPNQQTVVFFLPSPDNSSSSTNHSFPVAQGFEMGPLPLEMGSLPLSLCSGYAGLGLNFSEAITDGLNPLTVSQMPSDNSQRNSGRAAMVCNGPPCSMPPNITAIPEAMIREPATSPSTAMPLGTRAE